MISYLLINEVEAKGISGLSEPEEALTYLKEKYKSMKIVLTLGSKGCMYFDGKERIYQSAYKVDVKDTTAAGDTFTGYFVSELSKNTDIKKALQIASAASAIAVYLFTRKRKMHLKILKREKSITKKALKIK